MFQFTCFPPDPGAVISVWESVEAVLCIRRDALGRGDSTTAALFCVGATTQQTLTGNMESFCPFINTVGLDDALK